MAYVNQSGLPTLLDKVKRTDPDGTIASVVEVLTQRNPILQHASWQEGNLVTGHVFTSRTALPTVAWRKLNEGAAASKGGADTITESCGMMTGMSVVDVEVAKIGGNEAAFRASEDVGFLQAFNNEFARALIYESTKSNPERMTGIQPRLNQLNTGTAIGASQVVNAGGTGTSHLTSMYLVCWSPQCCFCIYPKGSTAGLEQQDMGIQLWDDGSGQNKKFRAYVTQWTWKVGMVIKDYRQVARVANINTNTLVKAGNGAGSGFLFDHMLKAHYQINDPSMGTMAWYCNRVIAHWLHSQALGATTNQLTVDTIDGKPIVRFLGVPIYVVDAIKGYNGGTVAAGTAESEVTATS